MQYNFQKSSFEEAGNHSSHIRFADESECFKIEKVGSVHHSNKTRSEVVSKSVYSKSSFSVIISSAKLPLGPALSRPSRRHHRVKKKVKMSALLCDDTHDVVVSIPRRAQTY